MKGNKNGKCVFITVGTTSFDQLVQTVTSKPILQALWKLGFNKVVLQIGRGNYIPEKLDATDDDSDVLLPIIEYFTLKDTIADNIRLADLVISHAGAGSILETLEAKRPLIVVINEDLMGNHQMELAGKLQELGHLVCCKCSSLLQNLTTFNASHLTSMEPGNPRLLATILDDLMGFS